MKTYTTKLEDAHAKQLSDLVGTGVYKSHKEMLEDWTQKFFRENPQIAGRLSSYNELQDANRIDMLERKERMALARIVNKYKKDEAELQEVLSFAHSRNEYLVGYQSSMYIMSDGEPYTIELIRLENKLARNRKEEV